MEEFTIPRMPIAAMSSNISWNHKTQNRMKRRAHFDMRPIANRNICIPIIFPREKACRKKYTRDRQSDLFSLYKKI